MKHETDCTKHQKSPRRACDNLVYVDLVRQEKTSQHAHRQARVPFVLVLTTQPIFNAVQLIYCIWSKCLPCTVCHSRHMVRSNVGLSHSFWHWWMDSSKGHRSSLWQLPTDQTALMVLCAVLVGSVCFIQIYFSYVAMSNWNWINWYSLSCFGTSFRLPCFISARST